jgi:hypothetical protein
MVAPPCPLNQGTCQSTRTSVSRLTLYRRDTSKVANAKPCVVAGSRLSTFSRSKSYIWVCGLLCLTRRVKLIDSWKQDVWSQFANMLTLPGPTFLELHDFNKATTVWDTLHVFLHNFRQLQSWLCVGRLWKATIFCELCADTCSDISNDSESEILESDSDIPTTISSKKSRNFPLVFTHDNKTSTEQEDRKVRVCETTSANRHSTWPQKGSQPVEKRTVSVPEEA